MKTKQDKINQYYKDKRAYWKKNGLCTHCGHQKEDLKNLLCRSCRSRHAGYWNKMDHEKREKIRKNNMATNKRIRETAIKNGMCPRCRINKIQSGRKTCKECSDYGRFIMKNRKHNGLCSNCGNLALEGQTRCKNCADRIIQRDRERKLEAISYKGGVCCSCGIKANKDNAVIFDFHHLDTNSKESTLCLLLKGNKISNRAKIELEKCVLLCSNCHRVEHLNINNKR